MIKRSALITGAGKRIGRALAVGLAENGFDVAVHYHHSESEAFETEAIIKGLGKRCVLLQADLQNTVETLDLVRRASAELGQIDLLVNNASIFNQVNFLDSSVELFDSNFAIHVRAPFFLTSQFAKLCQRGNVINIIDSMVAKTNIDYFAYFLSKKALYAFTQMAAKALAPNIRVNAIAPGSTWEPVDEPDSNYMERRARQVPLQMPGNPSYLLKGINFFLDNPFVTGECIVIDGGAHLQ